MRARTTSRLLVALAAATLSFGLTPSLATAGPSAPRVQPDADFAASFAADGVVAATATTEQVSCYAPEVAVGWTLGPDQGYLDGGLSPCAGAATTGEDLGPYPTQDVANAAYRVKDHAESDIRVDPTDPYHLIGQSKWAVNAEGYNHLLGFYESFDGGRTWPVQGHVPGYEGWADNTDPIGAFDPWGNFYSLVYGYQFYFSKVGAHVYDNGSNQTNPSLPPDVLAVAVHPAATLPGKTPAASWITTHDGHPDYVMTAKNANTQDPDKQWLAIDTNPASPHYGRIYATWTVFVYNPAVIFESHADARPDGTHTDWSPPQVLPTVPGKPWDTYTLQRVAPDGTVWVSTTSSPPRQGFSSADISVVWSNDGGTTWNGPRRATSGITVPTYANTTFREGILDSFAVGPDPVDGHYPLYVAYEDGALGVSNVYVTASFDDGRTWTAPARVNDNGGRTDALQPNLEVAPNGSVAVAFYDRRLACPEAGAPEATASGIAFDPGTAASPGTPYGRENYCVNTAIQFYRPDLTPLGANVRLSPHTWDPQLSAYHPSCSCSPGTFIGDYFGIASADGFTYTSSVTTFDEGDANPYHHQQQLVSRIATPSP